MKPVFFAFIFLAFFIEAYAQPLNISVKAKSAILYNPENGAILFQKNAKEAIHPASTIKIATVLFALEKEKDLSRICVASENALKMVLANEKQSDFFGYPPYVLEHDGVMLGLKEGEEYTMEDLLHGMLLYSGNDAANVLAEEVGGSIPAFMEGFNDFLKEKQILQTRFQNPHGLHHPAQMTTALDMAKITGLAFQNEVFRKIIRTPSYWINGTWEIQNTNRLLKEGKYQYPHFIGGKTGYIASSGFNLVAVAEEGGRRLIAVVLGYENKLDPFEDAIRLFETAFQEKAQMRKLFSKDPACFTREIEGKLLRAGLNEDVWIREYPSEQLNLEAKVYWHELKGKIRAGSIVGELIVENGEGITLVSKLLYAAEAVNQKGYGFLWWWALLILLILGGAIKARKVFKR